MLNEDVIASRQLQQERVRTTLIISSVASQYFSNNSGVYNKLQDNVMVCCCTCCYGKLIQATYRSDKVSMYIKVGVTNVKLDGVEKDYLVLAGDAFGEFCQKGNWCVFE